MDESHQVVQSLIPPEDIWPTPNPAQDSSAIAQSLIGDVLTLLHEEESGDEHLRTLTDITTLAPGIAEQKKLYERRRALMTEIVQHTKSGDKAFETLVALLRHNRRMVRHLATQLLGEIGDPSAVEPLLEALHDPNDLVRCSAAHALQQIGDTRAVEPLIELLLDPARQETPDADGDVSGCVQTTLIEMGAVAVEGLLKHISAGPVRYALSLIRDPQAVCPLTNILLDPQISRAHIEAVKALGNMGDPKAIPALERFKHSLPAQITSDDWAVKTAPIEYMVTEAIAQIRRASSRPT